VRCLVTGATGFIGLHLVRALTAAGHETTCLVRASSRVDELRTLPVRFAAGNVTTGEGVAAAVAGQDVVFHLAGAVRGRTRDDFLRTNCDGVRHVVEGAARCANPPVVVVASSLAATGPSVDGRPHEPGDADRPVSFYGASKLAGEAEARRLAARVPITIVRPPIVFGGGDRASFDWFRSLAWLRLHVVPGFRAARFSLVHVDDLVEIFQRAALQGRRLPADAADSAAGCGCYYAAADETPTYREIGRYVAGSLGIAHFATLPIPIALLRFVGWAGDGVGRVSGHPPAVGLDKVREAAAGSWICSSQTARDELAFRPAASLAEQFAATAAWYREQRWL
jgi:nucleoside-diphosphate-sugar epimerase